MITTIAYLAFAAIVLALAEQCSVWDAEEIEYRRRNNGESLDHAPMWRFRAAMVAGAALGMWLLANHEAPQHWSVLLPLLGFGAFAFSAWFRFKLNKRRKEDWRYCSPSNWYDYGFLMLSGAWGWKQPRWTWSNWRGFMKFAHWNNYELNPPYVVQVHRAGTIAYCVELTITAACLVWVALTL